ncbi:ADP-ribose 1''-phosphate phosphatase [Martiniozyma asiatica (nom. inval.)]|nr:ADP-ribose 1''-phosphate phosphatase [Martiniozyma asiatica]
MIKYFKGDLFQITKNSSKKIFLAHACNCVGAWGGGIAAEFKKLYPESYEVYHEFCLNIDNPKDLLGTSLILSTHDPLVDVICLFTSIVGEEAPNEIAEHTRMAMLDLKFKLPHKETHVNMPKINAGIFGVPWVLTENALVHSHVNCNVFEL